MKALLDGDSTQTQEELADTLGVAQQAVSVRLESIRMVQKQGNWVPYELQSRNADFAACQRSVSVARSTERNYGIDMLKLWYTMVHVYKTHARRKIQINMSTNTFFFYKTAYNL